MNSRKLTTLNLSITQENLVKLDEIKQILKSTKSNYKGRLSNALIISSLIELLYENRHSINFVNNNDDVKNEIVSAICLKKSK